MNKKFVALILATIILLSLSGCSISVINAQGLMNAPKADGDQQAIYDLMRGNNDDINFFYPKTGDYRSAIIMEDFTGDSADDAIGFSGIQGKSGIRLQFLKKDSDGQWDIISTFTNSATQIDRVYFADITGDGQNEVIVGWGSAQSMTATITIYRFVDDTIKDYPLGLPYSEMTLTDFTEDGVYEIFTASTYTRTDDQQMLLSDAYARIYTFAREVPAMVYSTRINNTIVSYTGIHFERMVSGIRCVILDGAKADNSQLTQVLTLNNDKSSLISPLSVQSIVKQYNYFYRPACLPIQSKDIDRDGFYELPMAVLTLGHSSDILHQSTSYRVDWMRYTPTSNYAVSTRSDIINYEENYSITIPQDLRNSITCYSGAENREVIFHKIRISPDSESSQIDSSEKLFSLRVFGVEEWRKQLEDGDGSYRLLPSALGENVYAVKIYKESQLTDQLIHSFKLISE